MPLQLLPFCRGFDLLSGPSASVATAEPTGVTVHPANDGGGVNPPNARSIIPANAIVV